MIHLRFLKHAFTSSGFHRAGFEMSLTEHNEASMHWLLCGIVEEIKEPGAKSAKVEAPKEEPQDLETKDLPQVFTGAKEPLTKYLGKEIPEANKK